MDPQKLPVQVAGLSRKLVLTVIFCTVWAAHSFAQKNGTGSGKITVGEIVLYVAIIVAVIAVAWFFSSRQTDMLDEEQKQHHHSTPRKHYDHPNDPHFRKLKKKTS